MTEIRLDVVSAPVQARLAQIREAPTAPLMRVIAQTLLNGVRRHFERESTPAGVKWPELKPATVRRRGSAHPILQWMGRLLSSLTVESDEDTARAGTNVVYAAIQNFGGTIARQSRTHTIYHKVVGGEIQPLFVKKRKSNFARDVEIKAHAINIPAREFMGISSETEAFAMGDIEDYYGRLIGSAA